MQNHFNSITGIDFLRIVSSYPTAFRKLKSWKPVAEEDYSLYSDLMWSNGMPIGWVYKSSRISPGQTMLSNYLIDRYHAEPEFYIPFTIEVLRYFFLANDIEVRIETRMPEPGKVLPTYYITYADLRNPTYQCVIDPGLSSTITIYNNALSTAFENAFELLEAHLTKASYRDVTFDFATALLCF